MSFPHLSICRGLCRHPPARTPRLSSRMCIAVVNNLLAVCIPLRCLAMESFPHMPEVRPRTRKYFPPRPRQMFIRALKLNVVSIVSSRTGASYELAHFGWRRLAGSLPRRGRTHRGPAYHSPPTHTSCYPTRRHAVTASPRNGGSGELARTARAPPSCPRESGRRVRRPLLALGRR